MSKKLSAPKKQIIKMEESDSLWEMYLKEMNSILSMPVRL